MKYKKYPQYKDSDTDWLGSVPKEWNIVRNKQAFNFEKNLVGKKSKDYTLLSLTLQGIKVRDLKGGKGKFPAEFDTYQKVEKNDIIFCLFDIDETPRTVGLSSHNGMITGAYNVARCNVKALPAYMYYYYLSIDEYKGLKPYYTGLRKVVRTETFMNIQLALPSLPEQQTIANYLDSATAKIDTLIKKQTKLIALLKEKRQAVISTAVTRGLENQHGDWNKYRLDWVSSIVRGNIGFKKDELLDNGEYVALQYGKTYKVDEVNKKFEFYINKEFYKFSQLVHCGDTILISTSETVEDLGHSCFYNRDDLGLIGGEQILLKPDTKLLCDKYLYYSSKVFCSGLKKYASGLKVFRFNTDDLKKIFISIPSLENQQDIANYIDDKTSKIDILIEKSTKSIVLLKERRVALISAAVTGKIDVREIA